MFFFFFTQVLIAIDHGSIVTLAGTQDNLSLLTVEKGPENLNPVKA